MKRLALLLFPLFILFPVKGEEKDLLIENKIFNLGITVGLKSSLPVINSITIDHIEADNIQMQYRVGYTASVFGRINVGHIFLQPTISWHHSSSEARFLLPEKVLTDQFDTGSGATPAKLEMRFQAIETAMLIGYKIIKEGPYALSLMAGPQIKYNYKTDYTFDFSTSQNRFSTEKHYFDINLIAGVGASIDRLFFDFKYEFGLNRMDSDFRNLNPSESTLRDIAIGKRINVISFSLGVLF